MSDLEHLVTRACAGQPTLRAPATLGARVMREVARREALPWWRRSFLHWPLPLRSAVLLACVLLVGILMTLQPGRALLSAVTPVSWLYGAELRATLVNTVFTRVGFDLARSLAPHGIYAAAAGICGLYLVLAGLCVTTYRTLYVAR